MTTIPNAKLDDVGGGEAATKAARLIELLAKYPEPWKIEKEPHSYNDGTKEFTHVRYRHKPSWSKGEEICVEIGSHVSPDLAELLILLRESADEMVPALQDRVRVLEDAASMARSRLENFADAANAGRVHYDPRELKRRIWAAFSEFDAALTAAPSPSPSSETVAEQLYEALKHGDDIHRAWLREAIIAFFAGQPIPPPRAALTAASSPDGEVKNV
jgi:hypothetical protein